jgi:hypothetical protein
MCRFVHVINFVEALSILSQRSQSIQRRVVLDSNKSDAPGLRQKMCEEQNYNGQLADLYNKFDDLVFQNQSCAYDYISGVSTKSNPPRPANDKCASIMKQCWELDPQCKGHKDMVDGAWIKKRMVELKRDLTVIYDNFTRSGLQDGSDNQEMEWQSEANCDSWILFNHNKTNKDVLTYCFLIFSKEWYNQMGKLLPDGLGFDGEQTTASLRTAEQIRNARHKESKNKNREKKNNLPLINDTLIEMDNNNAQNDMLKWFAGSTAAEDALRRNEAKNVMWEIAMGRNGANNNNNNRGNNRNNNRGNNNSDSETSASLQNKNNNDDDSSIDEN